MNFKGQSSFEFLLVIIAVLALITVIFVNLPQNTNEISALGIVKNNLDDFILKSNYIGTYTLESEINDNNISINIKLDHDNYNKELLEKSIKNAEESIKNTNNFENIYIYYK